MASSRIRTSGASKVESGKNNFVQQKEKQHAQAIDCREPSPDGSATRERHTRFGLEETDGNLFLRRPEDRKGPDM